MITLTKITSTEELMRWRAEVISNVFGITPDAELLDANRKYFESHISNGSHIEFKAAFNGTDCGCGGVCFSEELPSPDNPGGRCAYLMNIYVRQEFRDKGIAHQIVTRLIDESRRHCCDKIYLETSRDGRRLYYSLGFLDMPDMMKYYDVEAR